VFVGSPSVALPRTSNANQTRPASIRTPCAIRTGAGVKNCGRNSTNPAANTHALGRFTRSATSTAPTASAISPIANTVTAIGLYRVASATASRSVPAVVAAACRPKSSAP
jgi:hypothetical protein